MGGNRSADFLLFRLLTEIENSVQHYIYMYHTHMHVTVIYMYATIKYIHSEGLEEGTVIGSTCHEKHSQVLTSIHETTKDANNTACRNMCLAH